ncbi:MAG TPA: CPBP family intramembrane glutamic endopeptidase [Methanocella sp.]|uniref:CPBP family intramembrane glutamic endopeptidase n=1 Tax=Methanocella sp. TaxID=2052833 RepID=UPI002CE63FE5|nr:CPBP family intramembrane glutamic endopeptidase [Methanocella sp.]HTY92073.1 CPBP family intramembrane glutamic endopeptidase [Methanocella sp.]
MRRSLKLLLVLLFYLFNAWLVVSFSRTAGIFTYPLIIAASLFFILALKLKVPRNGLLEGGLFAAISMGIVLNGLLLLGAITVGPIRDNFSSYLLTGVVVQLLVSFGEELGFRAAIFQALDDELGMWPAAILSAAGFAALHLPSMGIVGLGRQSDLIALATIFFAGIVLALLYKYGGIFNAISFHFIWNYIEYDLFNMGPLEGAINVSKPGPEILTGGAFGPEASILTMAIMALLIVVVWLFYNKFRKPKGTQNLSP